MWTLSWNIQENITETQKKYMYKKYEVKQIYALIKPVRRNFA